MLCKEAVHGTIVVKKLLLAAASLLLYLAVPVMGTDVPEQGTPATPIIQEIVSKASLPLYFGKQICKWNETDFGFFGSSWEWGCKFVSQPICTATIVDKRGGDYVALTAGHCIMPKMLANYYVSDRVESEPVLRHVKVLKAENDDRYDYALIEFTSTKDYPAVPLNGPEDGAPAIGTELLNVNYSAGLGKQVIHGVVTSDLLNVDDLKNRYLTTLQAGPGASGSAIVDVKTGKIVGVLELGFPRSAMGSGAIPTGKNLFNFLEDDSAGLPIPPAVGAPPQPPTPPVLTIQDHISAIWDSFVNWLEGILHIG